MRARRGARALEDLCSGPGKLTQALGIELELNGVRPARPGRCAIEAAAAGLGGRRASSPARGSGSPRRPSCRGASARAGSRSVSRPWPTAAARCGRAGGAVALPRAVSACAGGGAARPARRSPRPAAPGRRLGRRRLPRGRLLGAGASGGGAAAGAARGAAVLGRRRGARAPARRRCRVAAPPWAPAVALGAGAVGVVARPPRAPSAGRSAGRDSMNVLPDPGREGAAGHRLAAGTRSPSA